MEEHAGAEEEGLKGVVLVELVLKTSDLPFIVLYAVMKQVLRH